MFQQLLPIPKCVPGRVHTYYVSTAFVASLSLWQQRYWFNGCACAFHVRYSPVNVSRQMMARRWMMRGVPMPRVSRRSRPVTSSSRPSRHN